MVDFTITPDALETIVGGFRRVGKETAERDAAAIDEHVKALETLEQLQGLERDFQQTMAGSHAKQSEVSEGILTDLGRIREINESIPLRVVEPIMGLFNPRFSRDKLKEEIGRRNVELGVVQSEQQLRVNEIASRKRELDLEMARQSALTGIQQSEAQAVSAALDTYLKQLQVGSAVKGQMILEADEAGLREMVKTGMLTERELEVQLAARQDEGLNKRLKILQVQAAEHSQRERDIGELTVEQLYNAEVQKRFGLSPERVHTMVLQRTAYDQALQDQLTESSQRNANRIVDLAPASQKEEWMANAEDGVVDLVVGGRSYGKVPLKQVQDSHKISSDAMLARAFGRTQTVQYEVEARGVAETIARASGVPVGENENPWDTLIRASQVPDFPQAAVTEVRMASQLLQTAMDESLQTSPQIALQARLQAAEMLKKAQESVIEARTAGMDEQTAAIARQHFTNRNGQLPPDQSSKVLTHQLMHGSYTGSPLYDNLMKKIAYAAMDSRSGAAVAAAITGRSGSQATMNVDLATLMQGRTPEDETVRMKIKDPQVQAALQADVVQAVYTDTYSAAAEEMRMPGLAARIRSGDASLADEQGAWSATNVLAAAREELTQQGRPEAFFEYVNMIRQTVATSAARVMEPRGPGSLSIAAVNGAVLQNASPLVFANKVRHELDAAYASLSTRMPQPAKGSIGASDPFATAPTPRVPDVQGPYGIRR